MGRNWVSGEEMQGHHMANYLPLVEWGYCYLPTAWPTSIPDLSQFVPWLVGKPAQAILGLPPSQAFIQREPFWLTWINPTVSHTGSSRWAKGLWTLDCNTDSTWNECKAWHCVSNRLFKETDILSYVWDNLPLRFSWKWILFLTLYHYSYLYLSIHNIFCI